MVIALRRTFVLACAVLGALACSAWLALAQTTTQTWPQRPVKFIVTLGAGSGVDIGMRLLADRLPKLWKEPVVVENRPGGDALVAVSAFVGAHDDHVLLATPTSALTAHPYVLQSMPYRESDLLPIARGWNVIIVVAVPASLATLRPQLEAGKIKLLAVTNSVRAPTLPDLPTVKEAGYPDLTLDGLVGLFGPEGMPLAQREHIAGDIREAAKDPIVEERLTLTGQMLNVGGPAEFVSAIAEQRARLAEAAKDLGITPAQ